MLLVVWGGQRCIGKITIVAGASYHLAIGNPRRGYALLVGDGLPMIGRVFLVNRVSVFIRNIGDTPA